MSTDGARIGRCDQPLMTVIKSSLDVMAKDSDVHSSTQHYSVVWVGSMTLEYVNYILWV